MTAERAGLPRTLRYEPGTLALLDQRGLPARCDEVRCTSAEEVASAIRDMVVRGAPAIGVAAAYGVVLAARRAAAAEGDIASVMAAVEVGGDRLIAARPTAVNLSHAVRRMLDTAHRAAADGCTTRGLVAGLEETAAGLERFELEASLAMGRLAADLLPDQARLLVHCNAGALATVERGTALAAVHELFERGRLAMVYVDETRPRLQGARLTAFELDAAGIPHVLVVDSLAPTLMRRGEIDAVLVGADRIAANGDVVNKVGTYGLAVACTHHDVPLIVVAPTSTIDAACLTGAGIPIEDRGPGEVVGLGIERSAPERTPVLNPGFDVTPAALVHALVTERGVVSPLTPAAIHQLLTEIPAPAVAE
ncbi:MAG TPA: S-methyl-5-thioribose-1-phosphate isomerase [Candidatus Dormibacteraeota bacterium]